VEDTAPSSSSDVNRRRSNHDQGVFTLPELPVKRGVKRPRQRVPPVLQGLHQPPPNANILPSISRDETPKQLKVAKTKATTSPIETPSDTVLGHENSGPGVSPLKDAKSGPRKKWTDEETANLLRGVAKFGAGSWKKILHCPEYTFNDRTAVDLKDR